MADASSNPLAEKRRLRKIENQRLEEEAKKRHEEHRIAQEQERQRSENERVAEEQRRLHERELIRQKHQEEVDRIASLENAERQVVSEIERQLQLVGAFCTGELELGDCEALPLSVAVLTQSALELVIPNVTDDFVFIADTKRTLSVYSIKSRDHLFSARFAQSECGGALLNPVAMPVCDQDRHGFVIIDLRTLFKIYYASSDTVSSSGAVALDGSAAVAYFCGGETGSDKDQFASPRGIAVDDTSNELYISDQMNHRVQVYAFSPVALADLKKKQSSSSNAPKPPALKRNGPVALSRSFGVKGHGSGQLQRPSGVDVSHYHVVVCDAGNSRLAVFAKRGAFVRNFGSKGAGDREFHDIRDVKLINVRKRVISRGLQADESTVANEQFEVIVADLGNFRIHVLSENGDFLRQLSLLSSNEQIASQRDHLSGLHASLLREYSSLRLADLPSLSGTTMRQLVALANVLHPSSPAYSRITAMQSEWREIRSRFHHPLAIAYAPTERELIFADRGNAKVFIYHADGSRSKWLNLPRDPLSGVASVHSILQQPVPHAGVSHDQAQGGEYGVCRDRLFVSDPQSHRIAVFDAKSLKLLFHVGATTYGDQTLRSNGFLPGELHHPSFLTFFTTTCGVEQEKTILVVSDSGNHTISLFDAWSGEFCGRVGEGFGHSEGYLDSPQGVAVYENRWLYVCDQHNHRIQIFDLQERKFGRGFGRNGSRPGEFDFPVGIAVCSSLPQVDPKCNLGRHREAKVLVADTGNHRLQIFAIADDFPVLMTLDVRLTPFDHPLVPMGVHIEQRSGCMLVCDAVHKCVMVFRHDGTFLTSFGSTVELENRFARPMDVIISSRQDRETGVALQQLLVADAGRCDVCAFKLRHGMS